MENVSDTLSKAKAFTSLLASPLGRVTERHAVLVRTRDAARTDLFYTYPQH